ncbi:chromosome partitioning protein ParB [Vibrio parahaemolyticus]|nr:chromosome partitioning protein ParB [Vibrio parahaemolyticus]EGQ8548765.1 chromosome partitioning protein ParB [Vibrio parahaemolyticus]EGQ9129686.1 chromosome partitioning protein ParB [Vibrio parahaemolyticus]EGQ9286445.1 chromosome partitioning protein ParB [Vibrio parahaemolyticus]
MKSGNKRSDTQLTKRRSFMNAITQISTSSNRQEATSVSPLDTQATAQSDSSIVMLPVRQLVVSDLNVRKSKASKSDDESLQASILAHGIIQNLVALPCEDDVYPVVSGGRRLTQLNALVEAGSIDSGYLVPVKVLSESEAQFYATEISLTENVTRAAMHPVDEFEAYSKMIEDGATVEAVAQRFGKTQLYVHQRMKLAAVESVILDAYREGEVSLERVMLFTIGSPERQLEVWEQVKGKSWHTDHQVRHMLKETALEASSGLVKLVGQEAYEQAGGVVTTDLFSDKVYFEDRSLMELLATAKIQLEADKLTAQGWKWTEILLTRTHDESRGYLELTANKGQYKKAEKALAGCILALGYNGDITVIKGLVAKSERKALKALQAQAAKKNAAKEDGSSVDAVSDVVASEPSYSGALIEDLKAHKLALSKVALVNAPSVALDALYYSLCVNIFTGRYSSTPMDVEVKDTHFEPKQGEFERNKALEAIEVYKAELNLAWLEEETPAQRYEAFCQLSREDKEAMLVFVSAMAFKSPYHPNDMESHVQAQLEIDAAQYWRPDTDSFLKRIDKDALIEIARPVMSQTWMQSAQSLKKGDLVKQLDTWLNGRDGSLTDAQKAHFAQWMPMGF